MNGSCGWANGNTYISTPVEGLCNPGTPSLVRSTIDVWLWHCAGSGGGRNSSCQALLNTGAFDPVAAGYRLVFDDEFDSFNGTPTGGNGWMTQYNYTGPEARHLSSKEVGYLSDSSVGVDPFSIVDGTLDITAAPGSNPQNLPYNSGVITSYKSFWIHYGYFEMRAQLPRGQGLWPAFWLVSENMTWPPEIDIVEMLGNTPTQIYCSTHDKIKGRTVDHTRAFTVPDTSAGFHTYGLDWEPSNIAYYFDGKPIVSYPTPADMTLPMYIIADLAVGAANSWPGTPDSSTAFPAHMYIDYIRAYASPESSAMGGSLANSVSSGQQ